MISSKHMKRRQFLVGGSAAAALNLMPGCARAADASLFVEDYRSPGANDRQTIARAIEALTNRGSGVLEFEPSRTYRVGRLSNGENAFVLRGLHNAELRGNGASLVCQTVNGQTQMLLVQNCTGLRISDVGGADRGADLRVEWKGMHFIRLDPTTGPIGQIAIDRVSVNGAVSLFTCSGAADSPRASTIRLNKLVAQNCYYGLSFQENGDDVFGDLTSINCRRTYFPYGVRRHQIDLDITHDGSSPGADSCILIKRYARDTGDIDLRARFHGVLAWSNLVNLSQEPPVGETGIIENVSVQLSMDVTVADPFDSARLAFSAYRGGSLSPTSNDTWRNIRLSGCLRQGKAAPVVYRTRIAHAPRVILDELPAGACV